MGFTFHIRDHIQNIGIFLCKSCNVGKMEQNRSWSLGTAVFYAVCSILITVVNKAVLTTFAFPAYQVLGLGQIVATVVVLFAAKLCGLVTIPKARDNIHTKIWPLPLFYVANLVFGLAATQHLNLPMFTVLRRWAILFTMIAEKYFLSVSPRMSAQISVFLMMLGALIAALDDLSFDMLGYIYIFGNNIFTAGGCVITKQKLDAKDLSKTAILYYNALFTLLPVTIIAYASGDLEKAYAYEGWSDPLFLTLFLLSCLMGLVLTYSIMLCMQHNSALTYNIVGVVKNLLVTYLGMIIGSDYLFSWINFTGLNLGVVGSLVYTCAMFKKSSKSREILKISPLDVNSNTAEKNQNILPV